MERQGRIATSLRSRRTHGKILQEKAARDQAVRTVHMQLTTQCLFEVRCVSASSFDRCLYSACPHRVCRRYRPPMVAAALGAQPTTACTRPGCESPERELRGSAAVEVPGSESPGADRLWIKWSPYSSVRARLPRERLRRRTSKTPRAGSIMFLDQRAAVFMLSEHTAGSLFIFDYLKAYNYRGRRRGPAH